MPATTRSNGQHDTNTAVALASTALGFHATVFTRCTAAVPIAETAPIASAPLWFQYCFRCQDKSATCATRKIPPSVSSTFPRTWRPILCVAVLAAIAASCRSFSLLALASLGVPSMARTNDSAD